MNTLQSLRNTVARLRAPDGCIWDREQTHQSIRDCLVEECAELLDAIDREDYPHMREELGDMLLQVFFHAQIAEEAGRFTIEDIAKEIDDKLIRRHPHIFGDVVIDDMDGLHKQWEAIKAQEKKNGPTSQGPFKDLPPQLSALLFARDIFKQITKQGLDAPKDLVDMASIKAQASSLDSASAGRQLFELAAACRLAKIDPESALREYTKSIMDNTQA